MFYRLLGKFFFLFYICPRIVREFRKVRKFLNPLIIDAMDKIANEEAEKAKSRRDHPAGSRRSPA